MQHIHDWIAKPMICFGGYLLTTLLLLGGDAVEF
jgi:hypothetical protein